MDTTPLGPHLVTGDELDDARDLLLQCRVNGRLVQEASTADMVFSPADVVAYVSTVLTLEPGDVLALGTPAGVGAGRVPTEFLGDGDTVPSRIAGIGELVNTCRLPGAARVGAIATAGARA